MVYSPLSLVDNTYKVSADARPSNYQVTHISWDRPKSNLNWYRYVVVRSPYGYPQSPSDGTIIFPDVPNISTSSGTRNDVGFTDDVILCVDTVNAAGTITNLIVIDIGAATGIALTSVSPISTGTTTGKKAVISLATDGSTVTIVNGGSNYSVGDALRIPGNSLANSTGVYIPGLTSSTQLGVTNTYHVYDTGAALATTANPTTTTGTNQYSKEYNKYYYSIFAYVAPTNSTSPIAVSTVITNNALYNYPTFNWIKIGETSSVVVYKNTTRSTKDILFDHLPAFYNTKGNQNQNKDLSDFLSLFAFHIDTYLAKNSAVFNMSDTTTIDEKLLNNFLTQFGANLKNVSSVSQARSLLQNIIRNYSLQGSSTGFKNMVESYTGNPVSITAGLNAISDYNTSSFVEGIGNWFPTSVGGYDPADPYDYTVDPMVAAGATTAANTVAQILDPSLTTVNISPLATFTGKVAYSNNLSTATITAVTANTPSTGYARFTVSSTAGLKVSAPIKVYNLDQGTGGSYNGTYTISNVGAGSFDVLSPSHGNLTSQTGLVSFTSTVPTNNYETFLTGVTSTGMTLSITTGDTSKIKLGSAPLVVSGTGVFATNTVVTYIGGDGKTLVLNTTPTTTLSNAKVAFSNNITSGSLSLRSATTTATLTFVNGTRRALTSLASTKGAGLVNGRQYISAVKPNVIKIGDYVSGHPSIPDGTKVRKLGLSEHNRIGLTNLLTADLPAGTTLYFSSQHSNQLGAAVDMIPVSENKPYGFVAHFNANGGTPKDTSVGITWYDANGNTISTYNTTRSAVSSTVPFVNANFATTWYPTYIILTSPSNAAYASPYFSVVSASQASRYCVDGMMFINPTPISKISRDGGTSVATITTSIPHNFYYDSVATNSGQVLVVVYEDSSFTNASSSAITSTYQDKFGNYTFTYGNSGATINSTSATGYAVSIPMIKETIDSNNYFLTGFQDAKNTNVEVLANRINLISNPSFEYDTLNSHAPYGWTVFDNSVVTVLNTGNYPPAGVHQLEVKKNATTASAFCGITQANSVSVTTGLNYTASTYLFGSGISVKIGIQFTDSTGTNVGTVYYGSAVDVSSANARAYVTALAPTGATRAYVIITSSTDRTTSITYSVDAIMFEQADSMQAYFDGDFDGFNYSATRDSMWESTLGQSLSHLYKNRVLNQTAIDSIAVRSITYA